MVIEQSALVKEIIILVNKREWSFHDLEDCSWAMNVLKPLYDLHLAKMKGVPRHFGQAKNEEEEFK